MTIEYESIQLIAYKRNDLAITEDVISSEYIKNVTDIFNYNLNSEGLRHMIRFKRKDSHLVEWIEIKETSGKSIDRD